MIAKIYKFFLFTILYCYNKCESTTKVNDRYYPRYHLAPPHGWMNDPNGFSVYREEYHLFYQYNPESSLTNGIAHWGHAKSKDLMHWEHLPVAMYPDQQYDKNGVFSGSAIVENDTLYLIYTAHVNHPGDTPDHEEHQALAISKDGVNVEKYEKNPVIIGADKQPDFRDPKIWKHNDIYYTVMGNRINNTGRVLLYSSKDMLSWEEKSVIDESDGSLGYMWECPDFFEIDGQFVLLFSPQGINALGDKYRNLYQTGYIVGRFDYEHHKFTPLTEFRELDNGHDFYATQTLLDASERRILVAWFDMWETNYAEKADGWTGQMTIPRELSITKYGRLIQKPVGEISAIRDKVLYSGKAKGDTAVTLQDNAAEVIVTATMLNDFELYIESDNGSQSVIISYDFKKGRVTLDRGGEDAIRRTKWRPLHKLQWRIFIDASSIELFCGEGEVTFSSRFFPDGPVTLRLGKQSEADDLQIICINPTVPLPSSV